MEPQRNPQKPQKPTEAPEAHRSPQKPIDPHLKKEKVWHQMMSDLNLRVRNYSLLIHISFSAGSVGQPEASQSDITAYGLHLSALKCPKVVPPASSEKYLDSLFQIMIIMSKITIMRLIYANSSKVFQKRL